MTEVREAVVQRVRDMLLNRTPAHGNVYVNRAEPKGEPELPSVRIYSPRERPGQFEQNSDLIFSRMLELEIDVELAEPDSEAASTNINAICAKIDRILLRDPRLFDVDGKTVLGIIRYAGWELTVDASSKRIINGATCSYTVEYEYQPQQEHDDDVRPLTLVHSESTIDGNPTGLARDIALQGG